MPLQLVELFVFNIFKIVKNVKKFKTLISVLHAIQTIIDKNNLMEILMDNVYVKMVIMMTSKIIVYASNVQHFGKLGNQLFF